MKVAEPSRVGTELWYVDRGARRPTCSLCMAFRWTTRCGRGKSTHAFRSTRCARDRARSSRLRPRRIATRRSPASEKGTGPICRNGPTGAPHKLDLSPFRRHVTMEQFADDLAGLLDALGIREPVVFCGLSMGGYIAFQFWRKYAARLRGLMLCDTRVGRRHARGRRRPPHHGRARAAGRPRAAGRDDAAASVLPRPRGSSGRNWSRGCGG